MSLTKAYLRQAMDIEIDANPEESPPENHLMFDSEEELETFYQKLGYNTWHWCSVRVEVYFDLSIGVDTLGGCSYESEEDFKRCPYYEDMLEEALEDLHQQVTKRLFIFTYNDPLEGK